MNPTEYLATVTTNDYIGKAMVATKALLIPILAEMNAAPPDQFFLNLHENLTVYDNYFIVEFKSEIEI